MRDLLILAFAVWALVVSLCLFAILKDLDDARIERGCWAVIADDRTDVDSAACRKFLAKQAGGPDA